MEAPEENVRKDTYQICQNNRGRKNTAVEPNYNHCFYPRYGTIGTQDGNGLAQDATVN